MTKDTPDNAAMLNLHIDVPGERSNVPRHRSSTTEVLNVRNYTPQDPPRVNRWHVPWRNDPRPNPVLRHANLEFGWPACFEDCCALGLDPYTGEVAA